jgi:hypothetical protein
MRSTSRGSAPGDGRRRPPIVAVADSTRPAPAPQAGQGAGAAEAAIAAQALNLPQRWHSYS